MTEAAHPRRLDRLLESTIAQYRTTASKVLLFAAIPLLVWALLALLLAVPRPASVANVSGASYAALAALLAVCACLALSWRLAIGLGVALALALAGAHAYERLGVLPLWQMALAVLALGWLLLFIGQRLGGRPAGPLRTVRDLLVGPLWWVVQLYRVLGLRT